MSRRKSGKTIPFTVAAVLDFVSAHLHIPFERLRGVNWQHDGAALPDEVSILVEKDGKDFLEVFRLEAKEREMRLALADIIERDELGSDVEILEAVSMETMFNILVKHVDLESLSGWVTSISNHEVRGMASNEATDFWKLWNHLGQKPKVKLDGRDTISPSFTMMKRLQAARSTKLSSDLVAALLELIGGDFLAACGIILQECRLFDWSKVIDDLVDAIGGVEGWVDPAAEVINGLVICPVR